MGERAGHEGTHTLCTLCVAGETHALCVAVTPHTADGCRFHAFERPPLTQQTLALDPASASAQHLDPADACTQQVAAAVTPHT
jgi:hypothetical protein